MTTKAIARRKPRGINPKGRAVQQFSGGKGRSLPEYLDQGEVEGLMIRLAQHPGGRPDALAVGA